MMLRPGMINAPNVTADAQTKRGQSQRRAFDFGFRNPQTGQCNSGQPIPSPAVMQSAYPRAGRVVVAKAGIQNDAKTIAAAVGTDAVKSHPVLGPVAKTETASIAETIRKFLVSRATKGARP
jgi:hypothetical protein